MAQPWAEMIGQAGTDADVVKARDWGQQLQAALAVPGSHGAEYLTCSSNRETWNVPPALPPSWPAPARTN
ncbi:hypothetical protein [Streptomyces sp. IBSBF 3352]|uniref:hypothetical protein n=1 Tax=Streptomyces sp. IBSBF 3352 TaxID=2903523 RepID=UPI002FDC484C